MIHPTAIIAPGARLHPTVTVGPYAVIGENVIIGAGTTVASHAVIEGKTEIGCDNRIFQFSSIGAVPQDLKFSGEDSSLIIGDRNHFREFVTVHLGTQDGLGITRVGSDCLLMAYSHVAHDCVVGNHVIMANAATLAGHVQVDDYAILGGLCAVHQFTRIGSYVMASGGSMIAQDIVPYCLVQGDRAKTVGLNLVGLKRRGFSEETIAAIRKSYRLLFRSGLRLEAALDQIMAEFGDIPEIIYFVDFIKGSQRGLAR